MAGGEASLLFSNSAILRTILSHSIEVRAMRTGKKSLNLMLILLLSIAAGVSAAQEITPEQRREIAQRIITVSAQVKPHEVVVIRGNVAFMPLMEDLGTELSKVGGYAVFMPVTDHFLRGVLTEVPEQYYGQPDPMLSWVKNIDVLIDLPFLYNEPEVTRDVSQARISKLFGNSEDQFRAAARESKVRSLYIEAPLPDQAALFGLDLPSFTAMQWQAIGADEVKIEQSGKLLADALAHARTVHVTAPDGTDFRFAPGQRAPLITGGITHPGAASLDERNASLPAGNVATTVASGSFEGRIVTPEDYCTSLEKLTGVSYQFSGGKLTNFKAEQGAKCLEDYFAAYSGPKDVVASVQIGLNPYLKSRSKTAPFNAAGMFWVSLGRDSRFGITDTQMIWAIPVANATVDVDGRTVINNGQLEGQ
jgi:aminopeptidase